MSLSPENLSSSTLTVQHVTSAVTLERQVTATSHTLWHVYHVDNLCLTQQAGTKSIQAHGMLQVPLLLHIHIMNNHIEWDHGTRCTDMCLQLQQQSGFVAYY